MKAVAGIFYANIIANKVSWIFTQEDMPEWNENDLLVVPIPHELVGKVKVGTEYRENNFIFNEDIFTEQDVVYGVLGIQNELLYVFTKEERESYGKNEKVVIIPENQRQEVIFGNIYDESTQSFILDVEHVRGLYIQKANNEYNNIINAVMGEVTPISEMISWETQEREAKIYLETKDASQATSIALMANAQERGLDEFANKVLEKAQKYRIASSFLIGYRQKVIRALENALDIAGLSNARFDSNFALEQLQVMMNSLQTAESGNTTEQQTSQDASNNTQQATTQNTQPKTAATAKKNY
ncbi:hypothetical protein [Helicobacter trogontum]|uniref:Uncharacterized protein n=1 Tax=Helicobacter trogontum TaxID=50960 RepID=A0A4U8SDN8_9HELI|nr:hypothetical protein [Helicobacter trogontum]TLD84259.1 hypothetical protein LS81_001990 [Helicobacter trogontum]